MKKITIFLFIFASVIIAAEVVPLPKRSAVDILIENVMKDYENAVKIADESYNRYVAPIQKRREEKIIAAGKHAIYRLNSSRKNVSEIEGIKLEQQIEIVSNSLSDKAGYVPITTKTTKTSLFAANGFEFNKHTYAIIILEVDWKTAKDICLNLGGHLVYIETVEELEFIKRMCSRAKVSGAWVGATDSHKEGEWRWFNGKLLNDQVLSSRFSRIDGKGNENHMIYQNGILCDVAERNKLCFICEWE